MRMKDHKPLSPVDWAAMTPNEIAAALRTIPRRIAYAWRLSADGEWIRDDADEYGVARAAMVTRKEDGTWRGPPIRVIESRPGGGESWDTREGKSYKTADAAKHDYDIYLRTDDWLIDDTDDGTGDAPSDRKEIVVDDETVEVRQYAWDDGTRVWIEVQRRRRSTG